MADSVQLSGIIITLAQGYPICVNSVQPCLANMGATRQMKWNRNNDNVVGEYEPI